MIMFKGIEDGGTNSVTDTEDGIELQPLSGLDDFGSIFAWARGAARSVGTTARSGASSPFDLMPTSLAKGAVRGRPSRAGYDLPFNTPRSYLSGFSSLEETVTFDVPIDGVMDDGLEGLGKISFKKPLKKAAAFAKKNPVKTALIVATAPVSVPTLIAAKAAQKTGQAAGRVMRKAPTPLKIALAPALGPAVVAGRIAAAAQRPIIGGGRSAAAMAPGRAVPFGLRRLVPGQAPGSKCPPGMVLKYAGTRSEKCVPAAAQAAMQPLPAALTTTAETADLAPSPLAPPETPPVAAMMTANAGQVVAAAVAKAEKDPFAVPAAAAAPTTGKDPFAPRPATAAPATAAPAPAAPGRKDRDPFAVPSGQQAAPVMAAETTEWDAAAYTDAAEEPPSETLPEEYANAEAITEPEYAEPDAGISPADEPEPAVIDGLGVLLGLGSFSAVRARKRLMARVPTGWVEPRDLLTKQGAAKLGSAGAKAALAAKLHGSKSKLIEQRIERLAREGRSERDQVIRDRKAGEALSWSRELLKERAAEARAARVAAGAQVALRFRSQAATATTDAEQKKMLGLAAGAVMATQTYAKTRIPVKLPAMLAQANIDKLRNAGPRPTPAATRPPPTTPTLLGKTVKPNPAKRGLGVPQGLTAFGRGRPAAPSRPTFRQSLPGLPTAQFAAQHDERDEGFIASLRGLGADPTPTAGSGTFDFINSIKDVASKLVGKNTAAADVLKGDFKSAAAKAAQAGQKYAVALKGGKAVATGPGGKPLTAEEAAVLAQIDRQSSSIMGQTLPILAVAGIGAAGLIVFLMRRKQA